MARSFNGTSDLIAAGTQLVTTPFTMAGWVHTAGGAYQDVFGTDQSDPLLRISNTNNLELLKADAALIGGSSGTITLNAWNHIAATYDGTNAAFYINGAASGTASSAQSFVGNNPLKFGISRVSDGEWFGGRMADMAWWGIATITAGEIAALAKGARPKDIRWGSIKGYWPLDGVSSPEPDLSGLGNNGTLTGTTNASGPPLAMFTPRWPSNVAAPAAPSFVPAWARQSNLPVIGAGTI